MVLRRITGTFAPVLSCAGPEEHVIGPWWNYTPPVGGFKHQARNGLVCALGCGSLLWLALRVEACMLRNVGSTAAVCARSPRSSSGWRP
jgi:hypothetical protein